MGNKIIGIFSTILMLAMCFIAITTLNLTREKKEQNIIENKTGSNILSTDGELSDDGSIELYGYNIISSLSGMQEIDERIPDQKEKIYTDGARTYTVTLNGNPLLSISSIDVNKKYLVTYQYNSASVQIRIKSI